GPGARLDDRLPPRGRGVPRRRVHDAVGLVARARVRRAGAKPPAISREALEPRDRPCGPSRHRSRIRSARRAWHRTTARGVSPRPRLGRADADERDPLGTTGWGRTMSTSVVIPTFGREAVLAEALASIAACEPLPSEVFVVDIDPEARHAQPLARLRELGV